MKPAIPASSAPAAPPVSRRALIAGAGTVVALPFLESLQPRKAQAAVAPRRFAVYFCPNGFVADAFFPSGTGQQFTLAKTLEGLGPLQSKVLLPMGLNNDAAKSRTGGNHAPGVGGILTCTPIKITSGADIGSGVSIDQVIASGIAEGTRHRSLHWGMEPAKKSAGDCDFGYSCLYLNSISYKGSTEQNPSVLNPAKAFETLFQGLDLDASVEDAARRKALRKSVLDQVLGEAERLSGKLSSLDRQRLDRYLTSVRSVEKRLMASTPDPGGACHLPETFTNKAGVLGQFDTMNEIMALAFECDITRVQTLMTGNGFSNRPFSFLGVGQNGNAEVQHHQLSHHNNDAAKIADLRLIDAFEGAAFARFAARLAQTEEEDGKTVLDNSVIMLCSDVQDGNTHSSKDCRIALVGSAGGRLRTGRAVAFPGSTPLSSLYTTLMAAFDVPGKFTVGQALPELLS